MREEDELSTKTTPRYVQEVSCCFQSHDTPIVRLIVLPVFILDGWSRRMIRLQYKSGHCKRTRNKALAAEPASARRSREEKWGEGLISRALYRQLRRLARVLLSSHQKYMQIVTVWFNHKLRICDMIGDWIVHRIAQIMHIKKNRWFR